MTTTKSTFKSIIENYTNARLSNWYEDVNRDYDVQGAAISSYDEVNDTLTIIYTENGITRKFINGNVRDEKIEWSFNVWAELADEFDEEVKGGYEGETWNSILLQWAYCYKLQFQNHSESYKKETALLLNDYMFKLNHII